MGGRNRLGTLGAIGTVVVAAITSGCGGGSDATQASGSTLAPGAAATVPLLDWTMDVPLENQSGKAEYPSVAIAAGGDAIAVFAQQIDSRIVVHAVHGNANSARWNTPRIIDRPDTSAHAAQHAGGRFQSSTQIAMHPATGDAIAAWSATAGGIAQVFAARYHRASDAWSAPVRLDTSAAGASHPVIAMNAQGNAVAVWSEVASGSMAAGIGASYFANGAWGSPVRLSVRAAGMPQAGIDALGNATVTWVEKNDAGVDAIMVAGLNSIGIASAARILAVQATPAAMPFIAVAPNGNALVAWLQGDGAGNSIYTSRFARGAWSVPEIVERLPGNSFAPAVALNDKSGFVAWEQEEAAGATGHAYAARLGDANTWSEPARVYNRGGYSPVIRLRDNGDAIMAWLAAHTQYATWSASASAWSTVTNIAPYNCGAGHALAMDAASGKAVAAWIPSNCGRHRDVYGAFYR